MMTKKLFSWLLLMTASSLILHSCRNDYLPDQQEVSTINNAFRYTYKRISLEESKHKINLVPELQKINEKLKTQETYALGKAVKYSNGVSVNTDDVIYIERGTNVHSYTFHITRENTSPDAPLENLVLSSQPDGTYKELLITYYFTPQEKGVLANGGSIDTKGKLSVEELNPGTYSGGILNKSDISCEWIEESYYTACSEGQHFNGESPKSQGGPCKADQPSTQVTVVIHRCKALPASTALGDDGTGGGGGPFGGTGGNNNGTPTIPNLTLPKYTPCGRLKDLLNPLKANLKPLISNGMYNYINNSDKGEAGIYLKKDSAGKITTEIATPTDTVSLPPKWGTSYYSMVHTHPKSAYPMFSYSDMMVLYQLEMKSYQYNTGQSSMILVCEDDSGTKQTYAIVFENAGQSVEEVWTNPQNIGCKPLQIVENMNKILKKQYDKESEKSNPDYERVFLQFNFGTNIGLYKASNDLTSWSKLTINANSDTAVVIPVNCN